jgi:hypothetical protein
MTYQQILDLINSNLASGNKIPALKHREVEIALLDYIQLNLPQTGDIKMINCNLTYLNANFEINGTGKNLRLGWRIYSEITGRVPLGFGLGYSELQGVGGFKDAVVIEHTHSTKYGNNGVGTLYPETPYVSDVLGGVSQNVGTVGVSGIDRNLQPYLITLYIIKL